MASAVLKANEQACAESESSCDQTCQIGPAGCGICGLALVEIAAWPEYSATEKSTVSQKARQRLALQI